MVEMKNNDTPLQPNLQIDDIAPMWGYVTRYLSRAIFTMQVDDRRKVVKQAVLDMDKALVELGYGSYAFSEDFDEDGDKKIQAAAEKSMEKLPKQLD